MIRDCKHLAGIVSFVLLSGLIKAQTPPAQPDELILNDGEKIIGHLEKSTGSTVTFKSDVFGELSVDWSKVKELHSSQKFAVIPKNVTLKNRQDAANVPLGTVAVEDQKVQLSQTTQPSAAQPIPVSNVADLVDQAAFDKAFTRSSFMRGWKGGATGGVSLTEATQKNQSFTGAINLIRATPDATWLDVRSRTIVNFNSAYSKLSQPGTPDVKTSLTHFDAEQDWYLSPRLFAFVGAALDHSFSQGLRLQQNYGGGLGFVVFKTAAQEFDVKASMNYIDQDFESGARQHLVGSVFGETYNRKFAHGILFTEQGNFTPSWNNTNAYTAIASAGLTFPVYHRLGFTIGALDDFINNPPPPFKKNSFQLTIGATYSFQ